MLEFPNASNKTFALGIIPANDVDTAVVSEKNFNRFFVVSVFPEPVTPFIIIDCGTSKARKFLSALSADQIM